MKKQLILILVLLILSGIYAQTPDSTNSMEYSFEPVILKDSIQSPNWPRKFTYIFRPDTTARLPLVLFMPRFGMNNPEEYQSLINHIVSKGNVVILPPYGPMRFTRDQIVKSLTYMRLFNESVIPALDYIDTTRIGFVGHGLGAGLIPSIARQVILKKGWGTNGCYMYIMAPWYFYNITERELSTFPKHVYSLIEVFDDDNLNDPRIASNLFNLLGLTNKKFIIVYGDKTSSCKLKADDNTPLCDNDLMGREDLLDTVAVMNIFDTVSRAAFKAGQHLQDSFFSSKTSFAIPVSSPECPSVKPMLVTDTPDKFISLKPYINAWRGIRNPYVERSSLRKSRKLYFKYHKEQIQILASHLIEAKKAEKKDSTDNAENVILENPIDSGYGADGAYPVVHDSIKSPLFEGEYVYLFRPESQFGNWPVVFMLHGYGGSDYHYFEPFITHIASKGYAVVYSPYPQLPLVNSEARVLEKQMIIKTGIEAGIDAFRQFCDTTKIGFFGQSFGSGQIPALTWWAVNEKNWGKEGAFMVMTAPWYTFGITQEQLQNFPSHVKLQVMVFDDDQTNDHQMGIDLFKSISIPDSAKDYIVFYSDSVDGYAMHANHFVPYGMFNIYGEENLLDYYGTNKLFDALADYTFNKNVAAKKICLGNGSPEQIYMGKLTQDHPVHPLTITDSPEAMHSEFNYFFTWDNPLNPRRSLYSTNKPFAHRVKEKIESMRSKKR